MMVRIAMVNPHMGKECGINEYTSDLIDSLKKQAEIITFSDIDLSFPKKILLKNIDIVHFQYEYSMYKFPEISMIIKNIKDSKIPIVLTYHSWSEQTFPFDGLIASYSTRIVVHSEKFKQILIRQGVAPTDIEVIPMGCKQVPEPFILPHNKQENFPRIGFFGFPFPNKGMPFLIDAINELKSSIYPDITGDFFSHFPSSTVNNPSLIDYQKELESKFQGNKHLTWHKEYKPVRDIVNNLHQMDINIVPYINFESNGISSAVKIMLAAQKPVITSDYIHFSDLTNSEVYKIKSVDVGAIKNAIQTVLSSEVLQRKLVRNSNLFMNKNNWKHIAEKYKTFYQKVITDYS
ncbi:glycosyltransferase [Fictibacillus fluitans]|uniref:Glycosyltransferase n=1 Tax=Fictibacillus fluitans TaxID=3058422 RepID=A0ABT8HS80_9BACL|nr:glycosyltransferase [Fictibacillus sp. NE201]MDN4523635.1 glycosyltransferase [Fictibacillus sp. NE201]